MPDPAVEAARLGLPYRESSTKRIKLKMPTAKVHFVSDPLNPGVPPRRVIEVVRREDGGVR